jgi:hypothetical protein
LPHRESVTDFVSALEVVLTEMRPEIGSALLVSIVRFERRLLVADSVAFCVRFVVGPNVESSVPLEVGI